MIEYEYKCSNCEENFVFFQSIKDKPLRTCYNCQNDTLERIIYGGIHCSVRPNITTLGQLAEKNSQKMGKYKLSELAEKNPKSDGKFVRTNKELRKKINKMTPEQQQRYIIEGK